MPNILHSVARLCVLFLGMLAGWSGNLSAEPTSSPDGALVVTTQSQASGAFTYALTAHGRSLLTNSRLGLDFGSAGKLPGTGWSILDTTTRTVDGTWQPIWGKRASVPERFTESTWTLAGPGAPFKQAAPKQPLPAVQFR